MKPAATTKATAAKMDAHGSQVGGVAQLPVCHQVTAARLRPTFVHP
jgi:hypothetical protein